MNSITIHRTSSTKGAKFYTPISNNIIQSKVLDLDEAGLLIYLLSKPIHYNIIKQNIKKDLSKRVSSNRFDVLWKSLVDKGYILKIPYPSKGTNLQRVRWEVFETPELREPRNQKSRKQLALESTDKEIKEIENKELKSNTGPNILGRSTNVGISISRRMNHQFEEAAGFLGDATTLGENIFNYLDSSDLNPLKEAVGKIEFQRIEIMAQKYIEASRNLGYLN